MLRTLTLLISSLLTVTVLTAADWPQWRGPTSSGSAPDLGVPMIDDIKDMKLVWRSEMKVPHTYFNGWDKRGRKSFDNLLGGYGNMAIVAGRIYLSFYRPAGELVRPNRKGKDWGPWLKEINKVSADEHIVCLDQQTGETIWERIYPMRTLHGTAYGLCQHTTPCVAQGIVVFLGVTGRLYALDAATGEALWEIDSGEQAARWRYVHRVILAQPEKAGKVDGLVKDWKRVRQWSGEDKKEAVPAENDFPESYLAQSDQQAAGGSGTSGAYYASPLIINDLVIVDAGGATNAFDLKTGKKVWGSRIRAGSFSSPVRGKLADVPCLFLTGNGVRCLDVRTGEKFPGCDNKYGMPFFSAYAGTPAAAGTCLVTNAPWLGGKVKGRRGPHPLTCYELTDQGLRRRWQSRPWTTRWNYSSPAISNGYLYAGVRADKETYQEYQKECPGETDKRGNWAGLVCVDMADGKVVGCVGTMGLIPKGQALTSLSVGDGLVALATSEYAVGINLFKGTDDLHHIGFLKTPFAPFTTPIILDGHLYFREKHHVVCYDLRKGPGN